MTKVILFDFWGTLVEQGEWSPIKQVRTILRIDLPFSEYVVRLEKALMTKKIETLREGFEAVCEEFGKNKNEAALEQLIGMWNKNWMLARVYRDTEEVLKNLQRKYKLVLISNTDSVSLSRVLEKCSLQKYFEKMFFSFEMGLIKTDPEFLQQVMDELDVGAEDCVLVGDSIQSDIKAGEKAGIKTVLIDRKNKRDYVPKIVSLRELEGELQ